MEIPECTTIPPRSPVLPSEVVTTWPAVDDHFIEPDAGYEVVEGEVFVVSPAKEPHGSCHSKLSALLEASVAEGFNAASDMLIRASERSNFAPDASLYPFARDPRTGGRRLEHLAFEVVSTQTLAHAGRKAGLLIARGVRRVFAIDVGRERVLEWSAERDSWVVLDGGERIEDESLAVPLVARDLLESASAHDSVARALLARKNAVIEDAMERERGHAYVRGRAEATLQVLAARGLTPSPAERRRILETTDAGLLEGWLSRVATCESVVELLDE